MVNVKPDVELKLTVPFVAVRVNETSADAESASEAVIAASPVKPSRWCPHPFLDQLDRLMSAHH